VTVIIQWSFNILTILCCVNKQSKLETFIGYLKVKSTMNKYHGPSKAKKKKKRDKNDLNPPLNNCMRRLSSMKHYRCWSHRFQVIHILKSSAAAEKEQLKLPNFLFWKMIFVWPWYFFLCFQVEYDNKVYILRCSHNT
jgi:hypothetical protein